MHVIKVAQLFPRSMHFAFELARVYISYSGEILEMVQGTKCTNLTWSIALLFVYKMNNHSLMDLIASVNI